MWLMNGFSNCRSVTMIPSSLAELYFVWAVDCGLTLELQLYTESDSLTPVTDIDP